MPRRKQEKRATGKPAGKKAAGEELSAEERRALLEAALEPEVTEAELRALKPVKEHLPVTLWQAVGFARLRRALGWSLGRVSAVAGLSRQAVMRIELAVHVPTTETANLMCEGYGYHHWHLEEWAAARAVARV